jgi:hypothetical protein
MTPNTQNVPFFNPSPFMMIPNLSHHPHKQIGTTFLFKVVSSVAKFGSLSYLHPIINIKTEMLL